jgi:hypothetical protein
MREMLPDSQSVIDGSQKSCVILQQVTLEGFLRIRIERRPLYSYAEKISIQKL